MNYDFYAAYYGRITGKEAGKWNQYTLLKCTKTDNEEKYKESIQKFYKRKQIDPHWKYIEWFIPSDASLLSESAFIKINFKLRKPYISKDDDEFWPKDNPICKDKVLKIPHVQSSSWKGALRHAIRDRFAISKPIVERLFGNDKEGEEFKRGRLIFYPTFLNQIGLDVIAPHERETKAGKKGVSPIYYETAPERTEGTFSLLYFPFDLLGKEGTEVVEEIKQDWTILKDAIPAMLTKYGFGAKTTTGYGVVQDKVKFQILPDMEEEKNDDHFGKEGSAFLNELHGLINRKWER